MIYFYNLRLLPVFYIPTPLLGMLSFCRFIGAPGGLDDLATPLLALSDILLSLNQYNYPHLLKLHLYALVANVQSAFHQLHFTIYIAACMLNLCATFLCVPLRWSTVNSLLLICIRQRLRVRSQTTRGFATVRIGTPKLSSSAKSFIALIRSSAAIRSPRLAAKGCRTFLLIKAAHLLWHKAHSAKPSGPYVSFLFLRFPL